MSSYSDKLRDPRWQKKRLEIMQRDEFKCQECSDDSSTLHVHHTRYIQGREPWDYSNGFLVTLCEHCHDELHKNGDSVIDHVADSFYEHGATWSILWGLAYVLDFSAPRKYRFSFKQWTEIFSCIESKMREIVERGES